MKKYFSLAIGLLLCIVSSAETFKIETDDFMLYNYSVNLPDGYDCVTKDVYDGGFHYVFKKGSDKTIDMPVFFIVGQDINNLRSNPDSYFYKHLTDQNFTIINQVVNQDKNPERIGIAKGPEGTVYHYYVCFLEKCLVTITAEIPDEDADEIAEAMGSFESHYKWKMLLRIFLLVIMGLIPGAIFYKGLKNRSVILFLLSLILIVAFSFVALLITSYSFTKCILIIGLMSVLSAIVSIFKIHM